MLSQLQLTSPRLKWDLGDNPWKTRGAGVPLDAHFGGVTR
jgi:hypothetical protein